MIELFGKIKNVIIGPKDFFAGIKKENDFKGAVVYYLLLVLIVLPLGLAASILFNLEAPLLDVIAGYIINAVIGLIASFIIIALYHLFVLIFGGRQGILRTYQAFLYGATPGILFSLIPFVNLLGVLYSIYLTVTGLSVLHEMRTSRAVLAYLSPVIIFVVLVITVVLIGVIIGIGGF